MDNKKIITSTAEIFTLSLLFVSLFNLILSRDAAQMRELSELFALCGEGVSFLALGEMLLLSALISVIRFIWFSPAHFKNMLMLNRITLMVLSTFCLSGLCSALFGWFPLKMWQAWLGFALSFGIATALSFALMLLRSRRESKKYQQNLTTYNAQRNNGDE